MVHVADGDTLELADGRRVRLIGINTPELDRDGQPAQPLAEAAAARVRQILASAEAVWLVTDKEQKDDHGRLLAHVFTPAGTNLEANLLAEGLGWHVAVPPNLSMADCLARAEQRARRQDLGVWQHPPADAAAIDSGGFKRIRGRVESINFARAWWIDLEGELAAVIYPEHQHRFDRDEVAALEGERIELQGWVYPSRSEKYKPWRVKLETPWGMEKL